jgi:hypothetical protein
VAHGSYTGFVRTERPRSPQSLTPKQHVPAALWWSDSKFIGAQTVAPLTAMRLARRKRLIGFAGTLRARPSSHVIVKRSLDRRAKQSPANNVTSRACLEKK